MILDVKKLNENGEAIEEQSSGQQTGTQQQAAAQTIQQQNVQNTAQQTVDSSIPQNSIVDRTGQQNSYNDYVSAMQTLQQKSQEAPGYSSQYDDAINAAFDKIINRGQFNYDLNADAMYQQYRDKYLANAKLSMMDTMGQAAALTGGYGSSYGQQVGQQAYDAQLQQLNDIVPTLYNQAYSRWQDEGTQLQQNYSMLQQRENQDYSRYQNDLTQWNTDRNYAQTAADDAYSKWANERNYADSQEATALERQDAELQKLLTLAAKGYNPTEDELAAAGVTGDQWTYYKKMVQSSGGTSKKTSLSEAGKSVLQVQMDLYSKGTSTNTIQNNLKKATDSGVISQAEHDMIIKELNKL